MADFGQHQPPQTACVSASDGWISVDPLSSSASIEADMAEPGHLL
jgi:hypothetical protein